MKLVCYYCSKEIVMPRTLVEVEEEENLKGSKKFYTTISLIIFN